jgi:serine/threonine protein phosphatase PrpC
MNPLPEQLTEDQTLVAKEVREGRITREQARTDPRSNMILQCVGSMKRVTPDFNQGILEENTSFLLCTDGFYRRISDEEMADQLGGMQPEQMRESLVRLTETVKERGEKDNITSILIHTFSDAAAMSTGDRAGVRD